MCSTDMEAGTRGKLAHATMTAIVATAMKLMMMTMMMVMMKQRIMKKKKTE